MPKTISEIVTAFIEKEAVQNKELVYFPPRYVAEMLQDKKGLPVNKMYIVRLYERLGIVWDEPRRVWVRKLS